MSVEGAAVPARTPREAAARLFCFLERNYWNGLALKGPDPGIRFNTRIGRFAKSYLSVVPWHDGLVYQQAQGYWILGSWMMWRSSGDEGHRRVAIAASNGVLEAQTPEGYWAYPNPEWRGRIATVEGCFAALGMLESYAETGDPRYLDGAVRWHRHMESEIGSRRQRVPSILAINYFQHSDDGGGGVPNNSTLVLWQMARLAQATGDHRFLEHAPALVAWLADVQLDTGELPYRTAADRDDETVHFLCHQYNAFEFIDLVHYRRITGDDSISVVISRLADFLATGVTDGYRAAFDCDDRRTTVLSTTTSRSLRRSNEPPISGWETTGQRWPRCTEGSWRSSGPTEAFTITRDATTAFFKTDVRTRGIWR